jgi:hypothetical protein
MENEFRSLVKTRKIGGSLVVTIPSAVVKEEQIEENEIVEIAVKKPRKDYFGALKGIGSFKEEDRAKGQFD